MMQIIQRRNCEPGLMAEFIDGGTQPVPFATYLVVIGGRSTDVGVHTLANHLEDSFVFHHRFFSIQMAMLVILDVPVVITKAMQHILEYFGHVSRTRLAVQVAREVVQRLKVSDLINSNPL